VVFREMLHEQLEARGVGGSESSNVDEPGARIGEWRTGDRQGREQLSRVVDRARTPQDEAGDPFVHAKGQPGAPDDISILRCTHEVLDAPGELHGGECT